MNMLGVTQEVFRQTQSVLEAVRTLHDSDNDFVAGLILFFSVTVPFLKALALVIILTLRDPAKRYRLYLMVRSLSKWAMADVFAVGVFIAMLAAQGTRQPRRRRRARVLLFCGVLSGLEPGVSVADGSAANTSSWSEQRSATSE